MKPARTLTLRKDTLVELTTGELATLVRTALGPTADGLTCTRQTLTLCPDFYCTGTC